MIEGMDNEEKQSFSESFRLRLPRKLNAQLGYWADLRGVSKADYIREAISGAIARENGNYDLPTLEIARLNELVDQMKALATSSANLERVVITGFDSLLSLTRGDVYTLTDDDEVM